MKKTVYDLTIQFETDLLGTQPQRDVAVEYIQSKAPEGTDTSDEPGTLAEELQKGTTAFHRGPDGSPIYLDYMIKGFLKESAGALNSVGKLKALRSKVDNYVFVGPRQIPLKVPAGVELAFLSRPLRAQTAQGPRTSLARSEQLPAGTTLACKLTVLSKVVGEKVLREILEYGAFKGMGQWRNGSHGQFSYTLTKVSDDFDKEDDEE